jgi:hypothetical protein
MPVRFPSIITAWSVLDGTYETLLCLDSYSYSYSYSFSLSRT